MMGLPVSNRFVPIALWITAALIALLALAWFDGGREDLREITVAVPVPEPVR